jgi:hypothetical protein
MVFNNKPIPTNELIKKKLSLFVSSNKMMNIELTIIKRSLPTSTNFCFLFDGVGKRTSIAMIKPQKEMSVIEIVVDKPNIIKP